MKRIGVPAGRKWRGRAALAAVASGLAALLLPVPRLSSLPVGTSNPYYLGAPRTGILFELAGYEAEVAEDPVWARPSLLAVAPRAKNLPIEPNVQLSLARLYERLGLGQKSLEYYEQVINASKGGANEGMGLFGLQRLFYRTGDFGRTISTMELVEKYERPAELAAARYLAGQAFLRLSTPVRAIAVLERVGEDTPEGPFARYSLGLAYAQQEKSAPARKAFEEAVSWARTALAPRRVTLVSADGKQQETRVVESALYPSERADLEAVQAKSLLALGYLHLENKKYAEAQSAFSEIPEENPFYAEALYAKAWAQIYQRQLVESIVTLNKLVKGTGGGRFSQEALLAIGSCYVNLKVYDKAIKAYQDAAKYYTDERTLADRVISESFVRDKFEALRLYFDPAAVPEKLDPFTGLSEEDQRVFTRVVSNPDARTWFERHSEVGRHLRRMRAAKAEIEYNSALVQKKLQELGPFEVNFQKNVIDELARLQRWYESLDDRVNLRGQSIDIWALASRKEADLLKEYGKRMQALERIQSQFQKMIQARGGNLSAEDQTAAEQTRGEIERMRMILQMSWGELVWKILGSAGGAQRRGRSADQMALYNKSLSKIKAHLDRLQESAKEMQRDSADTRARYRQLQQRLAELAPKQAQMLQETERYYLALSDKTVQAVVEVYKGVDRRLERFLAEAEFGAIGALDRQAGQ